MFALDLYASNFWSIFLAACVGVVGSVCDFSSILLRLRWDCSIVILLHFYSLCWLRRVCSLYFCVFGFFFAADLYSHDFGSVFSGLREASIVVILAQCFCTYVWLRTSDSKALYSQVSTTITHSLVYEKSKNGSCFNEASSLNIISFNEIVSKSFRFNINFDSHQSCNDFHQIIKYRPYLFLPFQNF